MPKISVNTNDDKEITKVEFYTKAVSAPENSYHEAKTVTAAPYSANWARNKLIWQLSFLLHKDNCHINYDWERVHPAN